MCKREIYDGRVRNLIKLTLYYRMYPINNLINHSYAILEI